MERNEEKKKNEKLARAGKCLKNAVVPTIKFLGLVVAATVAVTLLNMKR